ncbi:MAG: citrate transporter [Oscillospiraceae bacterium]|nr:citrate transporter [Oscillospiraceae bacterium]
MKTKLRSLLKAQPVLLIAGAVALLTMLAVPPDAGYLGYCNPTVLIQLFALMAAVAGLRSAGLFEAVTGMLLRRAGTVRRLAAVFVLLSFISAMFVTNDVALLTLVPLTLLTYTVLHDERSRILTIVLETAAANLGSMLTPIGNPQNIYLYDTYQLTFGAFLGTMLPLGLVSLVLLLAGTLLLPDTACPAPDTQSAPMRRLPTFGFTVLFGICLLTVLRLVPDWCCLAAALLITLLIDRRVLARVDYALLLTFVCFFVFVGNIGRIDAVRTFFSGVLQGHELIVSVLLSQVISNVPAAVMLSGFTQEGTALLIGVNLGGLGTLIASLASLISFQLYRRAEGARPGRYLLAFTLVSIALLVPLLAVTFLVQGGRAYA